MHGFKEVQARPQVAFVQRLNLPSALAGCRKSGPTVRRFCEICLICGYLSEPFSCRLHSDFTLT
jgi:hypothetical protein